MFLASEQTLCSPACAGFLVVNIKRTEAYSWFSSESSCNIWFWVLICVSYTFSLLTSSRCFYAVNFISKLVFYPTLSSYGTYQKTFRKFPKFLSHISSIVLAFFMKVCRHQTFVVSLPFVSILFYKIQFHYFCIMHWFYGKNFSAFTFLVAWNFQMDLLLSVVICTLWCMKNKLIDLSI